MHIFYNYSILPDLFCVLFLFIHIRNQRKLKMWPKCYWNLSYTYHNLPNLGIVTK